MYRVSIKLHDCIQTRVEVWENEKLMLWEHEQQASVFTEKGKQLVNFGYQNVNSLCVR